MMMSYEEFKDYTDIYLDTENRQIYTVITLVIDLPYDYKRRVEEAKEEREYLQIEKDCEKDEAIWEALYEEYVEECRKAEEE